MYIKVFPQKIGGKTSEALVILTFSFILYLYPLFRENF